MNNDWHWARELELLNDKLDLIMAHLGIAQPVRDTIPTQVRPEFADIDELIEHGKLIQAIKRYRELTGAGLREAKNAVETRAAERGWT